jgi:hypothetical protein
MEKSHKTVINTILVLIGIFMCIVIFSLARDVRNLQSAAMDVRNLIDAYKDSVEVSKELVRRADSVAAEEINKLRGDLVELSRLREMTLQEVKALQVDMKKEDVRVDSLGKTLLDW